MIITLFASLLIALVNSEYRYVYVMFRHGARAPFFDVDWFGTKWHPSELLEVGKRMHYLAGLNDREKYKEFIGEEYKQEEVYAYSTNYNRTIESLEARLQGLYNQDLKKDNLLSNEQLNLDIYPYIKKTDFINSKIKNMGSSAIKKNMQIPLQHSLYGPEIYDYIESAKVCPTSKNYYKSDAYKSRLYQITNPFLEKHKDMILNVLKIDLKLSDYESSEKTFSFCDVFMSNYYDGQSFQKLRDNGYDDEYIKSLYTDCRDYLKKDMQEWRQGNVDNFYFARLKASGKFGTIIADMDKRVEYDNKNEKNTYIDYSLPKLKYFSAHDTTLSSFLGALNYSFKVDISENSYVLYNSEIAVELSIDATGEYIVEIFYNSEKILSIKYADFRKKVTSELIIPHQDFLTFCGLATVKTKHTNWNFIFKVIIISLGIACGLAIIFIIINKTSKKCKDKTQPSNDEVLLSNIKSSSQN